MKLTPASKILKLPKKNPWIILGVSVVVRFLRNAFKKYWYLCFATSFPSDRLSNSRSVESTKLWPASKILQFNILSWNIFGGFCDCNVQEDCEMNSRNSDILVLCFAIA